MYGAWQPSPIAWLAPPCNGIEAVAFTTVRAAAQPLVNLVRRQVLKRTMKHITNSVANTCAIARHTCGNIASIKKQKTGNSMQEDVADSGFMPSPGGAAEELSPKQRQQVPAPTFPMTLQCHIIQEERDPVYTQDVSEKHHTGEIREDWKACSCWR